MNWARLSNALDQEHAPQRFRVTHPFHPLLDHEFDLVTCRHNWGEDRVYFHNHEGDLCSLPARWTSVVECDPVVVLGAGRSAFRVVDLLELVVLLRRVGS